MLSLDLLSALLVLLIKETAVYVSFQHQALTLLSSTFHLGLTKKQHSWVKADGWNCQIWVQSSPLLAFRASCQLSSWSMSLKLREGVLNAPRSPPPPSPPPPPPVANPRQTATGRELDGRGEVLLACPQKEFGSKVFVVFL